MRYELEVISPLHIGSGGAVYPIEYVLEDKFYRTNMDELFKDKKFNTKSFIEQMKKSKGKRVQIPPGLIKKHIRYALDITDQQKGVLEDLIGRRSSEIREHIKTKDKVYIPGSSIKGALRTAILWWVLRKNPEKHRGAKNILNEIEKEVFGADPTHDLLKALQVSDTNSLDVKRLKIEEVRTLTTLRRGHAWKRFYTFIEALKVETRMNFEMKIKEFFFTHNASKKLHFEGKLDYLKELPKICNKFADELIQYECKFFHKYNTSGELDNVLNFYKGLEKREKDSSFLLRLSWGSGWHGMTVGRSFPDKLLWKLRKKYGLGKRRGRGPEYIKEFPKTRRIVFENDKPKYPLGWVKLKLKEVD